MKKIILVIAIALMGCGGGYVPMQGNVPVQKRPIVPYYQSGNMILPPPGSGRQMFFRSGNVILPVPGSYPRPGGY